MKNKTSTIITVVIVILALIALVWPALRRSNTSSNDQTATTTNPKIVATIPTTTTSFIKPGSVVVTSTTPAIPSINPRPVVPASIVGNNTTVKAFFGRVGTTDCASVTPVIRVLPKTLAVGRASLISLLVGLTTNEKTSGYTTAINSGIRLKSLTITNGVALADFSAELSKGVAGSCRVQAIRSQITQTLKQFPTVKTVVIAVEGKTTGVLEP